MYRIRITKRAKKELKTLEEKDRKRIAIAVNALSKNPHLGKKLEGVFEGYYSYKVWPFRIVYDIREKEVIIVVIRIGHRQGVYK